MKDQKREVSVRCFFVAILIVLLFVPFKCTDRYLSTPSASSHPELYHIFTFDGHYLDFVSDKI